MDVPQRASMRGWLAALGLAAVTAATFSLGQWQLRRAAEKDALQVRLESARREPAMTLSGSTPALDSLDGRRVALSGRFDLDRSVFLDNRTREGVAGFHVLTPLQLDAGGAWVMVLRGWIAADRADRMRLPELTALEPPVRIEGDVEAELAQPMLLARPDPPGPRDRLWQHYEPATFRHWSGLPVAHGVVRQRSDLPDGLVRDWPQPGRGADRHRGYAFQWFAMAAAAALTTLVLTVRAWRRYRLGGQQD